MTRDWISLRLDTSPKSALNFLAELPTTNCPGLKLGGMTISEPSILGPQGRPVELPEDVADPLIAKASGCVALTLHVRWSGPIKTYDLSLRQDRARVYEQVLREGTVEDIRFYIDVEQLLDLWTELVLPKSVRLAWAEWFARTRHIKLEC